jgi:hypothetical protein|tara:strand:- start:65 stop:325 length:261 start_codon:yes stop_codon:yes gene_type:complete
MKKIISYLLVFFVVYSFLMVIMAPFFGGWVAESLVKSIYQFMVSFPVDWKAEKDGFSWFSFILNSFFWTFIYLLILLAVRGLRKVK